MTISAFIPVYNEEERIEYTLQSFKWCDEIFILDKSSSDKTVEICKKYGATIRIIENTSAYSSSEFDYIKECKGDWIMIVTASDIIDYDLGIEIKQLADRLPKEYNMVEVPFKNYILGIHGKKSPWYKEYKYTIFRKNSYYIVPDVHTALRFNINKKYRVNKKYGYLYHLTHVSVDMMMERHNRYWRGEADSYNEQTLWKALRGFLYDIKEIIKKGSLCCGWDWVSLSFARISYSMMSFVYKWEKLNNKASIIYEKMRKENFVKWEQYSK